LLQLCIPPAHSGGLGLNLGLERIRYFPQFLPAKGGLYLKLGRILPLSLLILCSYAAENRPGPSNLGNVISQILLCKQITPDFRQEELCSIAKDSQDVRRMVQDMQEFMPQQENNTGLMSLLALSFCIFCLLFLTFFFFSVLHFYHLSR
jgi:hypothetical protein